MRSLSNHWRGLTAVVLGLGTVLGAHFFLDTCADAGHLISMMGGKTMHMGCTWTERAIIGVGGLVAVMGLIMIWMREAARALSLAVAAAGILMIVIPVWLIPTCANATMVCNLSLKPGALALGGTVFLAGVAGAVKLARLGAPEVRA